MQTLRWLRVVGDTVFAVGSFALVLFVAGLRTGWSLQRGKTWSEDTGASSASAHRAHPS
jgi:nitric oxide reductase subunit B